jgi:phosphatidylinositol-4,5-bisphosphate 3-kinase catalytic subunit alpha/beta/delta
LGNFKSKKIVGIEFKREKAPFVFTPQFCHVLGGRDSPIFNEFVEICQKAYNCIRKHSHLFITLFQMVILKVPKPFLFNFFFFFEKMISTGIPELQSESDINWISVALALEKSNEEAAEDFKKLIIQSLETKGIFFINLK